MALKNLDGKEDWGSKFVNLYNTLTATVNNLSAGTPAGTYTAGEGIGINGSSVISLAATIGVSAYKASSQSISSGVSVKVTFPAESWDLGGDYASSTFTAPVAGRYRISGEVAFNVAADANTLRVRVYVDGSVAQFVRLQASGAGHQNILFNVVADMADTETVEIWAENATSNDTVEAGIDSTFMQIEYLGD